MIFLDAHVHIYPEYDLDGMFGAFCINGEKLAPKADLAMAVMLREFQPSLESVLRSDSLKRWRVTDCASGIAHVTDGVREITLIASRQIAAAERVEAIGFFGEAPIPDGLPLARSIERLRELGFLPAVAWGLGKWLGAREKVVRDIMASPTRPPLIADSALRPTFWPKPALYKFGEQNGMRVVYGSDPLPRKADETIAGKYATLLDAAGPSVDAAVRDSLFGSAPTAAVGRRHGLVDTIRRLV